MSRKSSSSTKSLASSRKLSDDIGLSVFGKAYESNDYESTGSQKVETNIDKPSYKGILDVMKSCKSDLDELDTAAKMYSTMRDSSSNSKSPTVQKSRVDHSKQLNTPSTSTSPIKPENMKKPKVNENDRANKLKVKDGARAKSSLKVTKEKPPQAKSDLKLDEIDLKETQMKKLSRASGPNSALLTPGIGCRRISTSYTSIAKGPNHTLVCGPNPSLRCGSVH